MKRALSKMLVTILVIVASFGSAFALDVPTLTGRVVDKAKVLSESERTQLSAILRGIETRSTAQVAILVIPSLEGEELASFSHRVASKWRLGQKGKNNGLLITVVTSIGMSRIEVGYGLEGAIPDATVKLLLIEKLTKRIDPQKKEYFAGLKDTVTEIRDLIYKEYKIDPSQPLSGEPRTQPGDDFDPRLLWFALAFIVAAMVGVASEIAGGVVGGGTSALIGKLAFAATLPSMIALGIVGILIGYFASRILQAFADSGPGFYTGGFSGSSSSSSSDSFSGSGGDFGGAGASDGGGDGGGD